VFHYLSLAVENYSSYLTDLFPYLGSAISWCGRFSLHQRCPDSSVWLHVSPVSWRVYDSCQD